MLLCCCDSSCVCTVCCISYSRSKDAETFKAKLDHLHALKKHADDLHAKLGEDEDRIRGYETRIAESDRRLSRERSNLSDVQEKLNTIESLMSRLDTSRARLADATASANELRERMHGGDGANADARTQVELDTSELRARRGSAQVALDKLTTRKAETTETVKTTEADLGRLRDAHARVLVLRGELIAAAREHKTRLTEHREADETAVHELTAAADVLRTEVSPQVLVPTLTTTTSVSVEEATAAGDDISRVDAFSADISRLEETVSDARAAWRSTDEEFGRVVAERSKALAAVVTKVNDATAALNTVHEDIKTARDAASDIETRSQKVTRARDDHYQAISAENALRREMEAGDYEYEMTRLSDEVQKAQTLVSAAQARVVGNDSKMSLRRELREKETKLEALLTSAVTKAREASDTEEMKTLNRVSLFDGVHAVLAHIEPILHTLDARCDALASAAASALSDADAEKKRLEEEEVHVRAEIRAVRGDCGELSDDDEEAGVDGTDAPVCLEDAQATLRTLQDSLFNVRTRASYVDHARNQGACIACARSFADAAALDAFCTRHSVSSLSPSPSSPKDVDRAAVDLSEAVQTATTHVNTATRKAYALRASMRRADRLQHLEAREMKTREAADAARLAVSGKRDASTAASVDLSKAREACADLTAAKELVEDVDAMRARLGSSGTADATGEDLESLLTRIAKLTKDRETVFSTKTKMEERARRAVAASTAAEEAVRAATARLDEAKASEERAVALEAVLKDAETACASAEEERQKADAHLRQIEEEKARASEAEEARRDRIADAMRRVSLAVDRFNQMDEAIRSYDAESRLNDTQMDLAADEARMQTMTQELDDARRLADEAALAFDEQVALLAQLDESIRLRELLNKVSTLETEVSDLKDKCAKVGDQRVLYETRDALQSVIARERSACDELRGSMRLAHENRRANEKALSADDFIDIDARVDRQLVELRTNEMSVVDLKGYAVALDKALQSLHAQKMAEINRIIRELWQRVYRNSDIDVRHLLVSF